MRDRQKCINNRSIKKKVLNDIKQAEIDYKNCKGLSIEDLKNRTLIENKIGSLKIKLKHIESNKYIPSIEEVIIPKTQR